jgi:phenylacetate-coenzyme A ligase PaaK-like adenylate-forming protein
MTGSLASRIFSAKDPEEFDRLARDIFGHQAEHNQVYKDYLRALGPDITHSPGIERIPFLPVGFFKNHKIITGSGAPEIVFESSGTTGTVPARHFVTDLNIYRESFVRTFRFFYGDPADYIITALLPSYFERGNSSLIFMVNELIKLSCSGQSGFYINKDAELIKVLQSGIKSGRKCLLIGVSFALLDLAEKHHPDLSGALVMETGGMKGRREEITRDELHKLLSQSLNAGPIHSEYGMTELLSQAYSEADGKFRCPPWMKVLLRDPLDPLSLLTETGRAGIINIIDLANINSCSFLATDDIGRVHTDGSFEVLGRSDSSEMRGCNLMVQ